MIFTNYTHSVNWSNGQGNNSSSKKGPFSITTSQDNNLDFILINKIDEEGVVLEEVYNDVWTNIHFTGLPDPISQQSAINTLNSFFFEPVEVEPVETVNISVSSNITLENGGNLEQATLDLDSIKDDISLIAMAMDKNNQTPLYVSIIDSSTTSSSSSVTVINGAGASAVNIQDGGNSITVDGTVTVVGAGDATAANQVLQLAQETSAANSLVSIDAGIPAALGQITMANSMPVTIASDQSPITVQGTVNANVTINQTSDVLDSYDTLDNIQADLDQLLLSQDKNEKMPLYVEETSIKKDINGALIPSDCQIFYCSGNSSTQAFGTIETTGYNSISLQTFTGGTSVTVSASDDGIKWAIGLPIYSIITNTVVANFNSGLGMVMIPCYGKFIQFNLLASTQTTVIVCLRSQPFAMPLSSSSTLGTVSTVTTVGTLTGGPTATGSNVASNPNLIAGVDNSSPTNKVRTIRTDTTGRLIITADSLNTSQTLESIANNNGGYSLLTKDTSISDSGDGIVELLAKILIELKINNQLMAELPQSLQQDSPVYIDPEGFRQDITFIN